jgi:hypothetical protein
MFTLLVLRQSRIWRRSIRLSFRSVIGRASFESFIDARYILLAKSAGVVQATFHATVMRGVFRNINNWRALQAE